MRRAFLLALIAAASCGSPPRPECIDNSTCDLEAGGACVAAPTARKWCRYPAAISMCPTGFIWSREAGDGLAGRCLDTPDAGQVLGADSGSDAPSAEPDASSITDAGVDSIDALLATLDATIPDAPSPDAAPPDASPPDASAPDADLAGPLTLTVYDKAQARLQGAHVVSHDAQGRWLSTETTDEFGRSTIRVPPGGAITVATIVGSRHLLTTIFAVEPGDSLTIIDAEGEPPIRGSVLGEARIKLPGSRAGATAYTVGSNCATDEDVADVNTPVVQSLFQSCNGSPVFAIATALNAAPENIAFTAGSATPSSGTATINLPGWIASANMDIALDNSSAEASIQGDAFLMNGSAAVSLHCTLPTTHTMRCPAPSVPPPGLVLRALVTVNTPTGQFTNHRSLLADLALPAGSPKIDLAQLPPVLGNLSVDLFTANRPRVRWSSLSPLDDFDGGSVLIGWEDQLNKEHLWMFVIPPGVEVTSPELPAAVLADWIPDVPASSIQMAVMWLGQGNNLTYADFRQQFPDYLRGGASSKFVRITRLD